MVFSAGAGSAGAAFVGATPAEDLPQDVGESVLEVSGADFMKRFRAERYGFKLRGPNESL
jgi:hypothetical protein